MVSQNVFNMIDKHVGEMPLIYIVLRCRLFERVNCGKVAELVNQPRNSGVNDRLVQVFSLK
jgi:hypothetical protein